MGKPKDASLIVPPTAGLYDAVAAVAGADLHAAVRIRAKLERQQAFMLVDARVQAELSSQARAAGRVRCQPLCSISRWAAA